jgi:GNAT superfamily N-acetyltransferase
MAELKFVVQKEIFSEQLREEMALLIEDHYQEVAWKEVYKKLNPDWDFYAKAQSAGVFKIFTARLPADMKLVGYWWFFVKRNAHYKDVVQAADDIIYVEKAYRGKPVFDFMQRCMEELKKMGVEVLVVHCKVAHDLEKLYTGLGFEPYEKNYIRRL